MDNGPNHPGGQPPGSRQQQDYLIAAMQASLDAVFYLRAERRDGGDIEDFVFTHVNSRGERMMNTPAPRMIGARLCELFPINRTHGFLEKYIRVVETGQPYTEQFHLETPEFPDNWFEHQVVKLLDGIAINIREITSDIRQRQELQLLKQRLELAVEGANLGMWDWDLSRAEIAVSPQYAGMLGYEPSSFTLTLGRWLEMLHPDDREAANRQTQEHLDGKRPHIDMEFRLRTQQGGYRWILCRGRTVIRGEDGRPERIAGTNLDITQRKVAVEEVEQQQEQLRRIVQSMPVLVMALDADLTLAIWNDECERITGYSADEMIGQPDAIKKLIPAKEDRAKLLHDFENLADDFRDWRWTFTTKSGHRRTVFWSNISASQPISGWVTWLVGTDITARLEAEQELARHREQLEGLVEERTGQLRTAQAELMQSERMSVLGKLTATVSHELRNPLGVIKASAYYLSGRLKGADEKVQKHITRIDKQVQICNDIVEELLLLTRSGQTQRAHADIAGWLRQAAATLSVPSNVKLELDIPEESYPALIDPGKLERALYNLANNAVHAMVGWPDGGPDEPRVASPQLTISLRRDGGAYLLVVKDNGCGMDDKTAQRAFEPLFTTHRQGTGLGLPLVAKIAEEHGGKVEVKSVPGEGTAVTIIIPGIG